MEHRWGKRVSADLDVQIFAAPASAGWGRLRDISVSGGFIETALRVPTLSKLCMTVPAEAHRRARIVHAIVVRKSGDGVGVEWLDEDAGVIAALIQDAAAWRTLRHARQELRL